VLLKVTVSCVKDFCRQPLGTVAVIHDITAEREIAQMKDDILSSVSHELKTPLASIRAYAEMLSDGEVQNEQDCRQFCDVIQEQAQRLNCLIDDILNVSRIEANAAKTHKQPVCLHQLIDELITTIHPQARRKEIIIATDLARNRQKIYADRGMLFQAILNLLSNAVKFSPERSTVTVRTLPVHDGHVAIEISDQGIGIPPEAIEHIFEKFYRTPEHQGHVSGTGLGLSLVKQVIDNIHNGHVTVRSQPTQGSVFTVYLPAQEPSLMSAIDIPTPIEFSRSSPP